MTLMRYRVSIVMTANRSPENNGDMSVGRVEVTSVDGGMEFFYGDRVCGRFCASERRRLLCPPDSQGRIPVEGWIGSDWARRTSGCRKEDGSTTARWNMISDVYFPPHDDIHDGRDFFYHASWKLKSYAAIEKASVLVVGIPLRFIAQDFGPDNQYCYQIGA